VPEGDPELLEILICQLRQDIEGDVVLTERRLVALQPQLAQQAAMSTSAFPLTGVALRSKPAV
jgi:hypothetical protein